MLALLSPAKKLDSSPVDVELATTQAHFVKDTRVLMGITRRLSVGKLKDLMHISDNLAQLNHERFQSWSEEHTADNSLPAALMFAGDVYIGLDARSLAANDLEWAQDHLAILSGLYGLLRPLDLVQPYRLEMGSSLESRRGKNLYAFWGDRIAKRIDGLTADHADRTIVNLASNEYFSAVPRKTLKSPVLDLAFQDVKDGKARTISFFAKRARGAMARWIIEHRIDRVEGLRDATPEGYGLDETASTDRKWVYRREQPPPVGG